MWDIYQLSFSQGSRVTVSFEMRNLLRDFYLHKWRIWGKKGPEGELEVQERSH